MKSWQLQTAKAQFSALVKSVENEGPQEITLHGKPVAVMMSRAAFDRLTHADESLLDFMQRSPLFGLDDIQFERDASPVRDVAL